MPAVECVVKVGGSLLVHPDLFQTALGIIATASRDCRLVVVPGGGPFADAVRTIDRRFRINDDAAHWMAVSAMDQYGYFIADRLGGAIVIGPREITRALTANQVPVLAPSAWLHEADPLPHAWTVTSDSIAAWVAGQLDARRLVLVKPPRASTSDSRIVDAHFAKALPVRVTPIIVPADQQDLLRSVLRSSELTTHD
jgi:aspartokinase-like uncharacterized kinase